MCFVSVCERERAGQGGQDLPLLLCPWSETHYIVTFGKIPHSHRPSMDTEAPVLLQH